MRQCVSKDIGLEGGGFGWIPHLLEIVTSVGEDIGPQRGVDCEIPQTQGDVSARRISPEGVDMRRCANEEAKP